LVFSICVAVAGCADVWGFDNLGDTSVDAASPGRDGSAGIDGRADSGADATARDASSGGGDGNSGFDSGDAADGGTCATLGCPTAVCCSGGAGPACQVLHSNGVGQAFYDCAPLGDYSQTLAVEACVAYVGAANSGDCTTPQSAYVCTVTPDAGVGPAEAICTVGEPSTIECACWTFQGVDGYVYQAPTAGAPCYCPLATDGGAGDFPVWN